MWVALGLVVVALALLWRYLTSTFSYWHKKGVPSVPNPRPIAGSMLPIMSLRTHVYTFFQQIYNQHKTDKVVGLYQGHKPALMICDPELMKQIVTKDFVHFTDHGIKVSAEADPVMARNLFALEGQHWRDTRAKLTPTFTSGRVKAMFPLIAECAEQLRVHITSMAETGESVDAKELASRYTTDVIGTCAFGVECNSFKDPNNKFFEMGKKLTSASIFRTMILFIMMFIPTVGRIFRLSFISKEVTNFFRQLVRDTIAFRAQTGQIRKDFLQLLIELKDNGELTSTVDVEEDTQETEYWKYNKNNKFSVEDIMAHATVFFLGGYETSATVISLGMLELAANPDVQRRAQQEIDEVLERHEGKVTYQVLQEMPYLDGIMLETLRKYPPTGNLLRICTKQYTLPDTDIIIEEGTLVILATHALQNDPNHFPNADGFEPDRPWPSLKYKSMAFGEGPRQCIGNRFAQLQVKLALLTKLRHFEIQTCPLTKYPVVFNPKKAQIIGIGGTWVRFAPRSQE